MFNNQRVEALQSKVAELELLLSRVYWEVLYDPKSNGLYRRCTVLQLIEKELNRRKEDQRIKAEEDKLIALIDARIQAKDFR